MLEHSERRADGQSAEAQAARYLEEKGFRLIERNFTTRMGEVDLIMSDGDTVVFVEVKRRRNAAYGEPEESVTPAKCRRIVHTAILFVQRRRWADRLLRFDVVIVEPGGIRHLPNAFDAGSWSLV